MNPRIFVGAAASVLIAILVVFWLFASDIEGGFFAPSTQEVLPLEIELFNFSYIITNNRNFQIL